MFGTQTALEKPGHILDISLSLNGLKMNEEGKYICMK